MEKCIQVDWRCSIVVSVHSVCPYICLWVDELFLLFCQPKESINNFTDSPDGPDDVRKEPEFALVINGFSLVS